MSSVLVSGLRLPVAVGGHPALDFCNTRAGWGSPSPKEYLLSYDHLVVWAREALLVSPADAHGLRTAGRADAAAAQAVLSDALRLRESSYPVLLGGGSAADFAVVADRAHTARSAAELRRSSPASTNAARWELPTDAVVAPLLTVAAQLDDLLCSPLSGVVAACPGRGCGWLFADPRRRRRWCDMAVCGNRAKVRRHAERVAARPVSA